MVPSPTPPTDASKLGIKEPGGLWRASWIGGGCVAIDQVLKYAVRVSEITGFMGYYPNYDGSFSLPWPHLLLLLISGIVLVSWILLLGRAPYQHPHTIIGGWLLIGGGISNLLDRLFLGLVVDTFLVGTLTFNVADVALVVGTGLIFKRLLPVFRSH